MFDACQGLSTHKRGALVVNEVQDHGDAEDVQAAEIEVEADGAQVTEIGDGKGMSGENGDAEGDAQNGDDGNANEDGALDIIGGQHADDGQTQDGQQNAGLGEVAHADATVEAADAGVAEAQIGDEEPDGAEMAVLMFLGIMRTMMSRRPRTVRATKITPEIRVMTMAEPKDIVPL